MSDTPNGAPPDTSPLWLLRHQEHYRELADPSVTWHDGKWYLYPSVDMAWVSEDMGATWQHHPLNVMVKRNGRYTLVSSTAGPEHRTYAMGAYASRSPLGPFGPQKRNPIFPDDLGA